MISEICGFLAFLSIVLTVILLVVSLVKKIIKRPAKNTFLSALFTFLLIFVFSFVGVFSMHSDISNENSVDTVEDITQDKDTQEREDEDTCDHIWVETGREEPTEEKQGVIYQECEICGETNQKFLPKINLNNSNSSDKYMLEPGGIFENGAYITVGEVNFEYDGEKFTIKNNGDQIVRISVSIVGTKSDGTYDILQFPAFGWVDKAQYEKDMQDNGWAVEQTTDMIRPGEEHTASISAFDFNSVDKSYPKADVDGDGYYEIIFTVSPQPDENTIVTSTNDPVSDVYKVKAK